MKILDCQNCGSKFEKSVSRYNEAIKNHWNLFCSIKCRYSFQEKGITFSCAWCEKSILKTPAEIRKTKSNVFCTRTCAAHSNNRNKQTGTKRSKLEMYLEQRVLSEFSDLKILCNSKKTVGYELDFYFPQLKLAIEINGIHHFQPIFGLQKLSRIQELDREKADKCDRLGIKLFIVDVSKDFHLSNRIKESRWKMFMELILLFQKSL